MGFPRKRCRSLKLLIRARLLIFCVILWIVYQGWSWWMSCNGKRSELLASTVEMKQLDELLHRSRHLCTIAKEMGQRPSFSVCKQSKFGTLNNGDIVLVSLECDNLSFEEQLVQNYEGRVTVHTFCSTASTFGHKLSPHRFKPVSVRPSFFRLDWIPYLGRHVWLKSVKQLLVESFARSSNDSVHIFKMGPLRREPVSAPLLLADLVENNLLDHVQQLHIEIDPETTQDVNDWILGVTTLNRAHFSLYRSKRGGSTYVTSWMRTRRPSTPESLAKVDPLDPNANFADKLQEILTAPSVTCSRRLSIPVTATRRLDFPALTARHWPLCLEHIQPPCLVYSAKIGGSDDFEDAAARLGCEVFLFDPSLTENETKAEPDHKIRSFNWGLGNSNSTIVSGVRKSSQSDPSDGMWQYVRSKEIVRELGHEMRTIDVLKLDVHGGEWDILQNFLTAGTLTHIRQIVVTMHVWHGEGVFSLIDRFMRTRKLIDEGFEIFHSESMVDVSLDSEPQRCCHIVGWIRTNMA